MTPEFLGRFMAYRKRLFEAIHKALQEDGHHKSYEGALAIHLPNYFVDDSYAITLDCYVLGPHRHYTWEARSLEKALDMAEADLRRWTA